MIEVHGATIMLMWATGGLFFTWITTRRREVGLGYGWTMRVTFGCIAAIGVATGLISSPHLPREIAGSAMIVATLFALWMSFVRRRAGVSGQRDVIERRSARVAQMTGIDRAEQRFDRNVAEFDPRLDLVPPVFGLLALVAGAFHAGGPVLLGLGRLIAGAAFLGALTDTMLLGHWYLVQPGLGRQPIHELVRWSAICWVPHLLMFLLPTGMFSALNGSIDDGYGGMLGWFWAASTMTTIALVVITRLALREKQYAAVMAATGLTYLAILTAFGQDLVARILLDPGL